MSQTVISTKLIANARIVLVWPHYAGNVGSTARVMRNFGLSELALVAPYADHLSDEAKRLSTHGEEILHKAAIHNTLEDAVRDCRQVLCTSGNVDGLFRSNNYGRPDEILPSFAASLIEGPSALVFGPEPSGLSNEEIAKCHGIIRILTDSEYPSLNLAQAVCICLYELRRQWSIVCSGTLPESQKIAGYEDQERMFANLRDSLEQIHFLWGTKADSLMHALRHLITRAKPSPNEIRILHGLARQIKWVVKNGLNAETVSQLEDESDEAS